MKERRPEDRAYFFEEGLRFDGSKCAECGRCCTGAPGTVYMNRETSERIAKFVGLPHEEFLKQYAYPFRNGHSLKEKENGDCTFFKQGRCTIYPVRPTQCRTYPFWPETLRNEAAWKREKIQCPGIGTGKLYSREEIMELVQESIEGDK